MRLGTHKVETGEENARILTVPSGSKIHGKRVSSWWKSTPLRESDFQEPGIATDKAVVARAPLQGFERFSREALRNVPSRACGSIFSQQPLMRKLDIVY